MLSNLSIVGSSCIQNVIMVANWGQGHLTKADDDGFVLVENKKKMASIQPTINKPTITLVYKTSNPYEVLSNDEIKVKKEDEIKVKENLIE